MKSRQLLLIAAGTMGTLAALLAAPLAAQGPHAVRVPRTRVGTMGAVAGSPGAPVFLGNTQNFEFIAAGPAFGGEVVTDAPYSAEAVTETQQALADGNKISRTNSSRIYRDSQGRTRREQTISALGPWSSAGEPTEMVFINDPVAGVNYVLNTNERTVMKTLVHRTIPDKIEGAEVEKDVVTWKAAEAGGSQPAQMVFRREHRELKAGEEGEQHDVTVMHSGVAGFSFSSNALSDDNVKSESLGKQMIEGVEADGSRTTVTIPAGQIGNERPIEIVSESWYSPQLKTLVMSKQNDPRMGETSYRLTNIQLIEPLPSMFEPPAGYTIQEGPEMMHFERKVSSPSEERAVPGR
jgi:hypothetical protein